MFILDALDSEIMIIDNREELVHVLSYMSVYSNVFDYMFQS